MQISQFIKAPIARPFLTYNNNNNNNNDLLTDPTKWLFPVKYYININILLTLILYKTLLLIIVTKTILQFTIYKAKNKLLQSFLSYAHFPPQVPCAPPPPSPHESIFPPPLVKSPFPLKYKQDIKRKMKFRAEVPYSSNCNMLCDS